MRVLELQKEKREAELKLAAREAALGDAWLRN